MIDMTAATMAMCPKAASILPKEESPSTSPMSRLRTIPAATAGATAMTRRKWVVMILRPSRLGRWERIMGMTTAHPPIWLIVLAAPAQVIQWLAGAMR